MLKAESGFARAALVGAVALAAALSISACSSSTAQTPSGGSASQIQTAGATVIDVRTPQEYASGHLQGAQNIDVSSPTFKSALSSMPKSGSYVVYCRSGNRSAAAKKEMQSLGFTNVTDAGSLQAAQQDTGLPVVTG